MPKMGLSRKLINKLGILIFTNPKMNRMINKYLAVSFPFSIKYPIKNKEPIIKIAITMEKGVLKFS